MTALSGYKSPTAKRVTMPKTFGSIEISHESNQAIRELAVSTFTDCANRGMDFADCLTTLLMTGMQFTVEVNKEKRDDQR